MTQPRPVWKSPGVPEAVGPHPVCTSAGCVCAGEEVKEVHVRSRSARRPGPERPWGPGRRAELWSGGPESPHCVPLRGFTWFLHIPARPAFVDGSQGMFSVAFRWKHLGLRVATAPLGSLSLFSSAGGAPGGAPVGGGHGHSPESEEEHWKHTPKMIPS